MYDLLPSMFSSVNPRPRTWGLPGTTASGLASASQLVDYTTCVALRVGATAASDRLLLVAPSAALVKSHPIIEPLSAAAYPVLAGIWDNDDDALYDTI